MINSKPKINLRLQNDTFKVFEVYGKSGDLLPRHQVDQDAILHVISGSIIYKENKHKIKLTNLEMHSIKQNQIHSLEFSEESRLLLFLFTNTHMKFQKGN